MASTSDKPESPGPKPGQIDDTVPAVSENGEGDGPPVRPTIPLDRYRIGKELGRGGMGRVVEAFDTQLGRTVALKEVLTKGTHRRFAREIHITARLEHASIVPLYDSGINIEGKPYYVMRKVTGKPLDEMVAKCRDLDERLTQLPALLAAIDAVAHAHSRGVIHRDLKPQNILVGELGETTVIDWGLAKVIGEKDIEEMSLDPGPTTDNPLHTQIGSVFGTPGFMAPEQARGEALDTQGDVYALGATLYQLLSGEPPVRGVSATEVMTKTRTHDIRPLADTAPGAPQELVAIVAKALAFDPNNRYRDAGELANDVRAFLTGQLVAAHDYSRWQKIARFGRRNRGVVMVTAIATVAVAIMSWIGVHRILTERDAANLARGEADLGKREAEQTRDRLAEQRDALLVTQARGLLETNPTEALAVLKQLPPTSARVEEARAIARAAITRGGTWAMQTGTEPTTQTELSPDGTRLLQVSTDGMVRVFDLDLRRQLVSRPFAPMTRATWVTGGKLLVTNGKTPPQLFEPVSGEIEALPLEPITYVDMTATGDRAIVETAARTPALFDVATRTLTPIPWTEKLEGVRIAPDGSWYTVNSSKLVVVFDRGGKELTRKEAATITSVAGSRSRTLAFFGGKQIFECVLDPAPVWTEVPAASPPVWIIYRGRELAAFLADGTIQGWKGEKPYRRGTFDRMTPFMRDVDQDVLVWLRDDGDLQWVGDLGRGMLQIPSVANRARFTGRPGHSRVAVVADGVVVVFDLAASMPRVIPGPVFLRGTFVDDDTLLVSRGTEKPWEWVDLATGKSAKAEVTGMIMPQILQVDATDGRVLARSIGRGGPGIVLLRKNTDKVELIAEGEQAWAQLIAGDAVVYGLGDAQVFAKVGSEPAKMVAKSDGIPQQAVGIGPLQFAVHASTGEILRVDLRTAKVERVRVPVGVNGFVAGDHAGHTLIVEDKRLMLWEGDQVRDIATFDRPISSVGPVEGGVAVLLGKEREVQVVEVKPNATPHRVLAASVSPLLSRNGKLVAGIGNHKEITLVELPSRARWTLPILATARNTSFDLSPNGKFLLQNTDAGLAIWRIPRIGFEYAAWLDERTNAAIDKDGVLVWPWQKRP